jgi:hypothetical protein
MKVARHFSAGKCKEKAPRPVGTPDLLRKPRFIRPSCNPERIAKPTSSSPQNLPVFLEENQKGKILSLFSALFSPLGRLNVSAESLNSFVPRGNPERIESLSPGLAQQRLPWVTSKAPPTLNGLDQTNTLTNPPRRPICSIQAEDLPIH